MTSEEVFKTIPTHAVFKSGGILDYRMKKDIIKAMEIYAEQLAVEFAQWCSKKNIHPNNYSYKLFKTGDSVS